MAKFAGGVSIDKKGYLVIKAGPLRNKRVHILVAEAMLGRKLDKDMTVHHRNLLKLDSRPENLKICGRSEHGYITARQAWFLKNRLRAEIAAWQDWIADGGVRPDLIEDDTSETAGAVDAADLSFDPTEFTAAVAAAAAASEEQQI